MKIGFTHLILSAISLCCFLLPGCASTPEQENNNAESQPQKEALVATAIASTNLVDTAIAGTNTSTSTNTTPSVATNITTNAVTPSSTLPQNTPIKATPTTDSPKPYTPKDAPRNWEYSVGKDNRFVKIDNTLVHLYKRAKSDVNSSSPIHYIDQTKIIDVIFNAHTAPIATNRAFRIFIDPGHGGADPGAIARDKCTYEKTITLDIAKRLQTYLSMAGFNTTLSRTDNSTYLSLEERCQLANRWGADMFISIHVNSSTTANPNGFETYVLANVGQLSSSMDASTMTANDKAFVNATYTGNKNDTKNLLLGFAIHRRTTRTSRIQDRGLRFARFHVLRDVTMPAVLVECGYISSAKDLKQLQTADYRERVARGIYQGICDYTYGRMQPGLAATPVPTVPQSSSGSSALRSISSPNSEPTHLSATTNQKQPSIPKELINAPTLKSLPKPPEWTPCYAKDEVAPTAELTSAREQALKAAGMGNLSPKTPQPPPSNEVEASPDKKQ